jgi:uncharacterized membrane protein YfhO
MDNLKKRMPVLLLAIVILLMTIAIFNNFIFKGYLYLYQDIGNDTINIYYPYYIRFLRALKNGNLSFWFNDLGLGNNILSMGELFTDPFSLILLPFGTSHLLQGLLFKAIISIMCAGLLFYVYESNFSLSEKAKVVGAILYAFNGYIILWGQHYHFATIIVLIPLLMHGYEKLLKKDKGLIFTLAVFLISFYSVYFLFMASIFLFIYAAVRYIDCGEKNVRTFLKHFFKSLIYYSIGLGLSAVVLFPSIWVMLSSPRLHNETLDMSLFNINSVSYYVTTILRLFSTNAVGAGDHYFGFKNYYESPILYSGVLTLLMLPFFFKSLNKRKVKIYLGLSVLLVVFLIFPFFSAMFNAFNDIAYRWTFMIIFLLIIAAAKGINYYEEHPSIKLLIATAVIIGIIMGITVLVGYGFFPEYKKNIKISLFFLIRSALFLAAYVAIFILYEIKKLNKFRNFMKLAIFGVLVFELVFSSYIAVFKNRVVEKKSHFTDRIGYNDYTNEAIKYIKGIDNSIYRIEKNYFSQFFNANLVQNFYGLKSYNSLNKNSTLEFLTKMEVPFYINESYIKDYANRHNLEQLVGVKYYLMRGKQDPPKGYTFLNKFNDVSVYKNDYYLPLGFTYDEYIRESDFLKLTKENKDKEIFKAIVIEDDNNKIEVNEVNKEALTKDDYFNDVSERQNEELNITLIRNGRLKGSIEIEGAEKTLFISVPYDIGWKAQVDGDPCNIMKANMGFMAINLEKGKHTVELNYKQPFFEEGIFVSIGSLLLIIILLFVQIKLKRGTPYDSSVKFIDFLQ